MYLINVATMKLEFFHESREQRYAILSHRWQDDEVLYKDMETGKALERKGYTKLKAFCDLAAAAGYSYAWCDTCCIDKSSSAELSESINSMFRWYRDADVCFAYLYDLAADFVKCEYDLQSEWFTRGWCLQELIAPKQLVFFNARWEPVGSRGALSEIISGITGVHGAALGGNLDVFSVAQRMSWAARRKTTRGEDVAYCLLGIFNVNMPLLYGEGGKRAFRRLQEEIIRQSSDQSVFVHTGLGFLAALPSDFGNSTAIIRADTLTGAPYNLTNVGLSISLVVCPWYSEVYLALLDCQTETPSDYVGIFVRLLPRVAGSTDRAVRVFLDGVPWRNQPATDALPKMLKTLYLQGSAAKPLPQQYGFWIRRFEQVDDETPKRRLWAISHNEFDSRERLVLLPSGVFGTAGIVVSESESGGQRMVLRVAFTTDFRPIVELGGKDRFEVYNKLGLNQPPTTFQLSEMFTGVGVSDDVRPSPIRKEEVLSDMSWTKEPSQPAGQSSRVLLEGESRDEPIMSTGRRPPSGWYEVFCRKMPVRGVVTWVLDVEWREKLVALRGPRTRGATCACCTKGIYDIIHRCSMCVEYNLCRNCIGNAQSIHDAGHEFRAF